MKCKADHLLRPFFSTDFYEGYDLFKRLTKIEEDFPGANIMLHKVGKVPQVWMYIFYKVIQLLLFNYDPSNISHGYGNVT